MKFTSRPRPDRILPKSFATLDNVIEQINQVCEYEQVVVEGHTDNVGADAYNQKLSERRAASVRMYLIGKGLDAAKLNAVGYGESKPVADNDTPDGRQKNRRVEFIIK
ncbi:MAG: OmpA family protein [Deltaproteobacteria bacterium]|nr:OmpA family protein [Deltaproteobacteria bacterium]